MTIQKLFLIAALVCFVLEALSGRMKIRAPFSLLGAGLAFWVASGLI
jgi:hypothetical protein